MTMEKNCNVAIDALREVMYAMDDMDAISGKDEDALANLEVMAQDFLDKLAKFK